MHVFIYCSQYATLREKFYSELEKFKFTRYFCTYPADLKLKHILNVHPESTLTKLDKNVMDQWENHVSKYITNIYQIRSESK